MTGRALTGIAAAVCAVLLGCSGLIGAVLGGAGVAGCPIPASAGASPMAVTPPAGGHQPVGRWTPAPIRASAAGIVSVVRCNAVDADTGADYGCDRDGDPVRVRGCGWYVDLSHAGGVITRYCHQLTRPPVRPGQHVAAGQVIGVVGSSGHSSGPHLHYEVHLGDHAPATATDPVAFMAAVGAQLGLGEQ